MPNRSAACENGFDIDRFFVGVRAAPKPVLMLDYDGTLAPFHPDPSRARPYPGVVALLDAIMAAGRTRLVMVSGRWTKDLLPLLGLARQPEIWGSHGWERLHASGTYEGPRLKAQVVDILVTADDWIAQIEALGARAERKPASLAFHWRGLGNDRIAEIRSSLFEKWRELAAAGQLLWHDFDGGIELRAAGRDKGYVVRTIMAEAGPDAEFAYLGDDETDEDAFRAMPPGSAAVLVRAEPRSSAANYWVQAPAGLLDFLRRWYDATGGGA